MAMSVVYTVWDGQIISENRGGVERDYVPDPLGNTIALVNSTHAITDSWLYWPYGEIISHVGSSLTPFTFLGTLGYFLDFVNQLYVRARFLRVDLTRWLTVDLLWPSNPSSIYASCHPVTLIDPSGHDPHPPYQINNFNGVLSGCLGAAAMSILSNKFSNGKCANAIQRACNSSGWDALMGSGGNITGYVSKPICSTSSSGIPAACDTRPQGTYDSRGNFNCTGGKICLSSSILCSRSPNDKACAIIFEMGNACACGSGIYDVKESWAAELRDACGCSGGIIGGGIGK